ncbi:hypothetical protein ACFV3R_19490 [Streptomyces sp. NPDC059740]|uniref:hypothetical protein n=1 Tax=Streptomyces sp. NPDC059740 TaxID=3346926 RepID=UPI003657E906
MSQLEVTSSDWSSGAGIVDSFNGLVQGVRSAQDGDRAAAAAEIGIGVVSSVLDVVSVGLDPLGKLTAAGLGWLIEHVAFLREPLDMLAGDPKAVAAIAESLHEYAQDLRNTAEEMTASARAHTASWEGAAADGCRESVDGHAQRIAAAGKAVDTTGYVVETTMAVITAVRALIRDMITSVLGDIIATMIVALAAAAWTFGASLVVGVSRCVILAITEVTRMMTKVGQLAGLSGRAAHRIDSLVDVLGRLTADSRAAGGVRNRAAPRPGEDATGHELATLHVPVPAPGHSTTSASGSAASGTGTNAPLSGFHDDGRGDDVYRDWLAMDRVLNPPSQVHGTTPAQTSHETAGAAADTAHSVPAGDPARASADSARTPSASSQHGSAGGERPSGSPATGPVRDSPLKRFDVALLKKHENWLRNSRFSAAFDRVKFVDTWTKSHFPAAYPTLKAIADAKSSKNYVGLADKFALTLGKSLTGIQQQAEQAWAASDQQQAQEPAQGEGSVSGGAA